MNQEERTQRSREAILDAALELFSSRGFRATSIRDISKASGISGGSIYYHFPDKESIFRALLDTYWAAIDSPDFPLNRALASGSFPDNLEAIGKASRDTVITYRRYVALIYVDVIEFEGSHIRKFYSEMADRFESFMAHNGRLDRARARLREGISPVSAVMLASRLFLNYFAVEVLFGVPDHFGKSTEVVIEEICDILRDGMTDKHS